MLKSDAGAPWLQLGVQAVGALLCSGLAAGAGAREGLAWKCDNSGRREWS